MSSLYLWVKALHVIAIVTWMAGLFYLPRLFVYHSREAEGTATARTFEVMEQKLLRVIMNPAMLATWVLGIALVAMNPGWLSQGWLHVKLLAVLCLSALHMAFARWRKDLAAGTNRRSERFYRLVNEVPTVLLIIIVVMVIVKPF